MQVTPDGGRFLLQSTEVHPGERQIYAVAVSGGAAHAADAVARRARR